MKYICQTMENFEKLALTMDVVLFGSGEYCMRFMNRISSEAMGRIKCILDNDKSRQGGKLYGIPIEAPDKLKEMDTSSTLVVITTKNSVVELYEQTLSIGDYPIMMSKILINDLYSAVAEDLYNNQDAIAEVSGLLYDDASREIYHEVIKRRMLYGQCDFSDLFVGSEYIFPLWHSEKQSADEVILDCGAYNGDTLKKFITIFGPALKRIYAFECMAESLEKLKKEACYAQNGKYVPDIVIMPYALSDHEGKTTFAEAALSPVSSFIVDNLTCSKNLLYESNYVEVDVSTIDSLIPEDEKVTLIKMDIEGSEYEAILGAKRVIQRWKPKLAISLYHLGKDYYRLPLLVKELVPEYKIAIRHHSKKQSETDMYCWI